MVTQTVHRYMALLATIFLINLHSPWHTNLTLRIIKSPKLYLIDSGLLTYLLGIDLERALDDTLAMGKVIENFVVTELRKQITWSKTIPQIHHFRTISGIEVDIVLENRAGDIVGIEVKNAAKVVPTDFKGLTYLQEKAKSKFKKGIVLYTGSKVVPFGNKLFAVPIHALWEQYN